MRKYLPTISELIDRLSIVQLKEVFIPEHKEEYAKEIQDIVDDLDELMKWEKPTGEMIRAIVVLSQMNLHIWHNETKYRAGEGDGNLGLTHGLNGIRNTAKNKIEENLVEVGRKDYKIDCLAEDFEDWEVSWQVFKETRERSVRKSIGWRIVAVINSYIILAMYFTDSPLYNAIAMNVTGAVLYYVYERLWNNSKHGRYDE